MITGLSGEMQYSVNGEGLTLKKEQALVINAEQMHFRFSRGKTECDFLCVIIHPAFLCPVPAFEKNFVSPLLRDQRFHYVFLRQEFLWTKTIYEKNPFSIIVYERKKQLRLKFYIPSLKSGNCFLNTFLPVKMQQLKNGKLSGIWPSQRI